MALRRADEAHFYSRDQVAGILDDALAVIAGAELSDDLRVPAFVKVLDLLGQKQVQFEQVGPAGVLLDMKPKLG